MSKIPFTLDAWLKDKSQKVETRDGRLVHNIWRVKKPSYTNNRKMEVCALIDGEEDALVFFEGGRYLPTTKDTDNPFDLFIVTPEPELTDWETLISGCLQKYGLLDCGAADRIAKKCSAELLSLAREQFIKDGYIIEKKAFYDAVEKIDSGMIKEVSAHIDFENLIYNLSKRYPEVSFAKLTRIAKAAYQKGAERALMDLPRWKKWRNGACGNGIGIPLAVVHRYNGYKLVDALGIQGEKYIMLSDLETLPGFKEDESHE